MLSLVHDDSHISRDGHDALALVDDFCRMEGRLTVIDVGANDGSWADAVMRNCYSRTPQPTVHLVMIEPQNDVNVIHKLKIVSQRWNAVVMHSAAWTHGGNLTLHIGGNRETTSLVKAMASRYGRLQSITVPAVDLAAVVSHEQQPNKTLLKIDIEGSEYRLIPSLIRLGTFCELSHLIVEWHLNAMPPKQRLTCLGLRLSFDWMVRMSCGRNISIAHSEYFANNEFEHIPGLWREALRHDRSTHPVGRSKSPWEIVHRDTRKK